MVRRNSSAVSGNCNLSRAGSWLLFRQVYFPRYWARVGHCYSAGGRADRATRNVHPLDLAFRLAENYGIVLLNGGGFNAPDWPLCVSLANLGDEVYEDIGRGVRSVARSYRDALKLPDTQKKHGNRYPGISRTASSCMAKVSRSKEW